MWAKEILFNFYFDNSASSFFPRSGENELRLFNGTINRSTMKGMEHSFPYIWHVTSDSIIHIEANNYWHHSRRAENEIWNVKRSREKKQSCFGWMYRALGRGANSLDGLYICKFCVAFSMDSWINFEILSFIMFDGCFVFFGSLNRFRMQIGTLTNLEGT